MEISSGHLGVYLSNRLVQAFLGRGHLSTLPAPTGVIFLIKGFGESSQGEAGWRARGGPSTQNAPLPPTLA